MDIELENRIKETVDQLKLISADDIDLKQMDPVVKMLLVALLNETQKINDRINNFDRQIVERYCTNFIPRQQVEAMPAIALINPTFKPNKETDLIPIGSDASFTYKMSSRKQPLNYIPLFNTTAIPHSQPFVLTNHSMRHGQDINQIDMGRSNRLWIGIPTKIEIETLKGLTLLIKGTQGVSPERVSIGSNNHELDFALVTEMENIEMAEPFDAQQASSQFFSFIDTWKECLLNTENVTWLCITDNTKDRDLFKRKAFPHSFLQRLENETIQQFDPNTLWIHIDFPNGFVVPDNCEILLNVIPVVNVDLCCLTLTQASPIAKLQKQDDSFFLRVLETSTASNKQGFGMVQDEIIIRDFDADCYHSGDLYRDVRNLYNRFVDDYYAFIEYNEIKDGETLKQLRETINKIANNASVKEPNKKFKFDSGTYVMKNMKQNTNSTSVKVNYIATQGKAGNTPKAGETMENKKLPMIDQKVSVVVSAMGGTDKASPDERYELLRYYSLTNDRLFTKMDINAFLRKEIMSEFGKEESKRIFLKLNIEGAGGQNKLQRGLYIDIEFKDSKNYDKALAVSFDTLMKQRIENKSCIAMPIIVRLKNLEE